MTISKRLTYEKFEFEVDEQANKNIYALLISDADMQMNDEVVSFYLANRDTFYSSDLVEFLEHAGVDLTKENEIINYSIDSGQLIIEGWYDVVGQFSIGKTLSFCWGNGFYTTNIYFSNGVSNGIRKEFTNSATFRIDFAIVVEPEFSRLNNKDIEPV